MKYLVVIVVVFALIAEYELRKKIKIRCSRRGRCKIKIKYRSLEDPIEDSPDDLNSGLITDRNVDYIDEGDLNKRQTAILENGLQQLLQQVFNKRGVAEAINDV